MSDPNPAHLLIVDDDERIRDLLKRYLIKQGFMVTAARDAVQARRLLKGLSFDLIVLDVMMPGETGLSLTQWLRGEGTTPVILLTARGESQDRITGLEAGADDYIPKPFEPRELVLRINAILRRTPQEESGALTPQTLVLGALRYDVETGELRNGHEPVRLTQTELAMMRILASRQGETVSREALIEHLGRDRGQQSGDPAQERAIDVQITRLRRKIEADPRRPRFLQTVRGEGYKLTTG